MFQTCDKGFTQMPFHRLIGRRPISLRNCQNNRLMFIQGHGPPPLDSQGGRRQKRHRAINQIQLLHQKPIVRRQMQLLVKSLIGPCQSCGIRYQLTVRINHLLQHIHLFNRRMLRRQTRRQPLKLCAHHIEFRHLIMIKRGDN